MLLADRGKDAQACVDTRRLDVAHLTDGIKEWIDAGHPVEKHRA